MRKSLVINFVNKFTILKIKKNESNSTWVTFSSFSLIKCSFSSWVDFSRLSDLKKKYTQSWVIWVCSNLSKNHTYQKYAKGSFNINLLAIQSVLCAWPWCLQLQGIHENRIRSSILGSGSEAKYTNHSATKAHLYLKQQEKYKQAI